MGPSLAPKQQRRSERLLPPAGRAHLKLQERDVEELVEVLQAEAVLHGGLGVAEVRGAWRPACNKNGRETAMAVGSQAQPLQAKNCTPARLPSSPYLPKVPPAGDRPLVQG